MAVLKLKLKMGGQSGSSGSPSDSQDGSKETKKAIKTPKIKLNPPKIKASKVTKPDKIKKLKINFGPKKASLDNIGVEGITQQVKKVPKVRVKPTRVPGDGYDSETPDMEDDPLIENGIVIRFLDDMNLDSVHNAVDSNDLSGINVKWLTKDKALVNIRGSIYSARLVDLPTISEVFKTIDKKNIFKVLDICQMLLVVKIVSPNDLNLETDFEIPSEKTYKHPLYDLGPKEIKESRPVLIDGLTAPFENVYRRFRPKKLNHRVMDDIEAKVNELIQLDEEAEESHFELLDKTKLNSIGVSRYSPSPPPMMQQSSQQSMAPSDSQLISQEELGAASDEDLEEELAKALETNVGILNEEDGEELVLEGETPGIIGEEEEDDDDDEEEDDDDDDDDDDDEEDDDDDDDEDDGDNGSGSKSDNHHTRMLQEEIADLEKAVEVHRKGLANATHKMMKMKFQNSYNTLKASLDNKKKELTRLLGQDEDEPEEDEIQDEEDEDDDGEDDADVDVNADADTDAGNQQNNNGDDIDDLDDLF